MQIAERAAQRQIGVLAVEQQTENGLRGARVVDHLLREEDAVQAAVLHDRTGRLVVLHPLEQEDEAMDRSASARKKRKCHRKQNNAHQPTTSVQSADASQHILKILEFAFVETPQLLHLDACASCKPA